MFLKRHFFNEEEIDMGERFSTDIGSSINEGLGKVARAITPLSALAGTDAAGGRVESLTEAVMGVTAGLVQIAEAITDLADAVRERDA